MKSLALLVTIFYPLIFPVWEKEPFDSENIAAPQNPYFLGEAEINGQLKFYNALKDPRLRDIIGFELKDANSQHAVTVLETMLKTEKTFEGQADILYAMKLLQGQGAKIKFQAFTEKLFTSQDPQVRALAILLYFRVSGKSDRVLKALAKENSFYVLSFLKNELDLRKVKASAPELKEMLESPVPLKKALGTMIAVLDGKNSKELIPMLKETDQLVKVAAAEALQMRDSGGVEIAEILSKDENTSVRSALAAILPSSSERLDIIARLSSDKDWGVRMTACFSLGKTGSGSSEKAFQALLPRLGDESPAVREAAENSMIKLNPSTEMRKKIVSALGNKASCDSALTVLAGLKERRAAAVVLKILKSADNPETVRRAVKALGIMKYPDAEEIVAKKAESPDVKVRVAVAFALGRLAAGEKSFAVLAKLSMDKAPEVVFEAIKSMGILGDKYFNPALLKALSANDMDKSLQRSAACWALARVNSPNDAIINRLKDICAKQIVPTEMEATYDSDYARIASAMCLYEYAKNNKDGKYRKSALFIIEKLKDKPLFDPSFNNPSIKEYARQIYLAAEDKKDIKPEAVETREPSLKVRSLPEPSRMRKIIKTPPSVF